MEIKGSFKISLTNILHNDIILAESSTRIKSKIQYNVWLVFLPHKTVPKSVSYTYIKSEGKS